MGVYSPFTRRVLITLPHLAMTDRETGEVRPSTTGVMRKSVIYGFGATSDVWGPVAARGPHLQLDVQLDRVRHSLKLLGAAQTD
jgi:hypothetical protein